MTPWASNPAFLSKQYKIVVQPDGSRKIVSLTQPANASAIGGKRSSNPPKMTQTHSPPDEKRSSATGSEAPAVAEYRKNHDLSEKDDLPFRRTPATGEPWPAASTPGFSHRGNGTGSPEDSADVSMSSVEFTRRDLSLSVLLTFGDMCSPEKKDRIDTWLNRLAYHEDMEAVAAAKPITATLYRDWLHWSKHAALTWLVRLDKVERRFRIASLSYHQTPYALRHSATLLHGSRIDQVVLNRLSDILESDRSRTQQTFFSPWYEIKNVAADILKDLDYYEPIPDDLDFLRTVHRKFELSLIKLPEALHTLVEGLKWLEATIWEVAERSDLDGSEALASKHSREGGLFRRWMLSLPELDPEFVESKSEYIEWYVDRLLEVGVEKDQYWSNLVDLSSSKDNLSTL